MSGYPWSTNDILTASDLNAAISTGVISTGLGAWTSFTPTWTNVTVGNASQASAYFKAGKFVAVRYRFVFGSTSAFTGAPLVSLPVGANTNSYGGGQIATYRDVSASADYNGIIRLAGTSSAWPLLLNVTGANDSRANISSTTPFTWASGDILDGFLCYEAA